MEVVYILISDRNDYYFEQLFLSIASLQKHSPNMNITIIMDTETNKTLDDFRGKLKSIASTIKVVNIPIEYSKVERSRYLKTNLRRYISGDFIFLDCDTLICAPLDYDFNFDIAAVYDLNNNVYESEYLEKHIDDAKKCNFNTNFSSFFNSGVILVRDTPDSKEFFEMWHHLWKESLTYGINRDQPSFNECNSRFNQIITPLDGSWNYQLCSLTTNLNYLGDAKVLHYFQPPNDTGVLCEIGDPKVWEELRRSEEITDRIRTIIEEPKRHIKKIKILIESGEEYSLLSTPLFKFILKIYKKNRTIFNMFNNPLIIIRKLIVLINRITEK